jgi:hypothetical protein
MGADLILIPTANTTDEPMEMFEWEIRVQAFQNSNHCNDIDKMGKRKNHFKNSYKETINNINGYKNCVKGGKTVDK